MKIESTKYKFWDKTGPISIPMTNDRFFIYFLLECPNALCSIVSSVLRIEMDSIKSIEILNPIKVGDTIDDKEMILDLNILMNDESIIDIEMQVSNEHNWTDRCIGYIYRMDDTLARGQDYKQIRPIIQVGFLDYTLFSDKPEFFSIYKLWNVKKEQLFTDKLQVIVVDLTQIDKATEEDVNSGLVKWAKFFKANNWAELQELAKEDPIMAEAAEKVHDFIDMDKFRKAKELIAQSDRAHRENLRKELEEDKRILQNDIAVLKEDKQQLEEDKQQLEEDKQQLEEDKQQLEVDKKQLEDENAKLKELLAANGITVD